MPCTTVMVHPPEIDGIAPKGCAFSPWCAEATKLYLGADHTALAGEALHGGRVPGITGGWILNGPRNLQLDCIFAELYGEADEFIPSLHLDLVPWVEVGQA